VEGANRRARSADPAGMESNETCGCGPPGSTDPPARTPASEACLAFPYLRSVAGEELQQGKRVLRVSNIADPRGWGQIGWANLERAGQSCRPILL